MWYCAYDISGEVPEPITSGSTFQECCDNLEKNGYDLQDPDIVIRGEYT